MKTDTETGYAPGRREVLRWGFAGLSVPSLVGCDLLSTEPDGETGRRGEKVGAEAKEAPTLAEAVAANELPPLVERLPEAPMVVEPIEEAGHYGGQLSRLLLGTAGDWLNTAIGYENVVRWKPGATRLSREEVIPNVAEDFAVSDDGSEYTFKLRRGLRWSDGELFTAADILFWFEDVAMNEELSPAPPVWLVVGDEPPVAEMLDEYTIVFRFFPANSLFVLDMATQKGGPLTGFPAHYLKRFHKGYADDIDRQVEESGYDSWTDLFASKASLWENPDLPTLNAWLMTAAVGAGTQRPVARRNPYYWKTDPDGRQLPYLDEVAFTYVEEAEAAILKVTNGEIDVVERDINLLQHKPVFAQSRESGEYHFFETIPIQMNQMIIMLNLTHKDPVLRDVFSNKTFRIGLSHAINRQEIIDVVFQRQGEPWQAAPRPESQDHHERLAKQYTEFDLDAANGNLDQTVPDRNDDGVRLRPDGAPLSFRVEVSTSHPDLVDALEVLRSHWNEVGVDIAIKSEAQSLFFERMDANDHDAAVWVGGGGLTSRTDPMYYMPYNFNSRYAMPWHFWYENPDDERAEEPPAEVKRQIGLYRELLTEPDSDQQDSLMREIMEIAAGQFYCMGVALRRREYGIFSNRLGNAPATSITGWGHAHLMPSNPQQYFTVEE